jgi:hypothetical protein
MDLRGTRARITREMHTRSLPWIVLALGLIAPGTVASAASGDGLPLPSGDAGLGGVADPTSGSRYVTLNAGRRTVLARVLRNGGSVFTYRFLRGSYTIPAVAIDGSASGLSRDGKTLVLIRPRNGFPQSRTKLIVLDPRRLSIHRRLTLRGDFSFDAISPDGRLMYLIEYLSPRNLTRYAVRAFDLRTGRLLAGQIVDPREPDERMGGFPITRAVSPDGRWAYTLYDGAGKAPFVHALDTVDRTAACIDLDALAGNRRLNAFRLGLSSDGGRLFVNDRGRALAAVDTKTFRVSEPATRGDGGGARVLTLAFAGAAAVLLAAGVVSLGVRRRRRLAAI